MSNQDTITAILKANGANPVQIAGIEGNLSVESSFNPNAYNANENAWGIAQWEGSRLTALKAYAASVGKPFTDLATQVGFLIKEGGLGVVANSTTPTQAATAFDTQYERSTLASLPARIAAAVKIFGGGSVGGATTPSSPASGSVAPTASNYFTKFLQGLGIAPTAGALQALASVENYEGNNSRYNPFNVIQPEPGSTAFNSVGVQSYASFDSGVQGSVALFQGAHWAGVRSALATGNPTAIVQAFDAAYSWSPGTNIPLISGDKLNTELTRNVGPNPGTGSVSTGATATNTGYIIPAIPGAPDWLNGLISDGTLGAAGSGGIPGQIGGAVNASEQAVGIVAHVIAAFTNPENWLRFGLIFIGIIVLIIGVDKLADGDLVGSLGPSDSPAQIPSEQAVAPMPIAQQNTPSSVPRRSAAPTRRTSSKSTPKSPTKAKAATTAEVAAA